MRGMLTKGKRKREKGKREMKREGRKMGNDQS
jgi:hypothetical protein